VNALRAWLARPLGWFTFVFAEYVVAIAVLRGLDAAFPDLPMIVGLSVLAVTIGALFWFNLWLRRRLARAPRDADLR
jgi:hypothetical protein